MIADCYDFYSHAPAGHDDVLVDNPDRKRISTPMPLRGMTFADIRCMPHFIISTPMPLRGMTFADILCMPHVIISTPMPLRGMT